MHVLFDTTARERPRLGLIVGTIAGASMFGFLPAYAAIVPIQTQPLEWVVFGLLGTVALLFLAAGIMALFAQEQMFLEADQVRSVRWLGRFESRWAEPLDAIEEVRVYSIGPNLRGGGWGPGKPSVLIRTQKRRHVCCFGAYPPEAEKIVEQIRSALPTRV